MMRKSPTPPDPSRRLRVALVADEKLAVVRDFLRGFYGRIRPQRDWLLVQSKGTAQEQASLLRWKPDILVVPAQHAFREGYAGIACPLVRYMCGAAVDDAIWFHPDETAVGAAAAAHLIAAGYREAACVVHPVHHGAQLRKRGFETRMRQAGIPVRVYEESPPSSRPEDARMFTAEDPNMRDWLASLPPSTGVYAWSDGAALWVAECAFRMNLTVPEHLGIVGTDNQLDLCQRAWPPLDSVMLDYAAIGEAAADWIAAWVLKEDPVPPEPFPFPGVYRRHSTRMQGGALPGMEKVFSALGRLEPRELSVAALARAAGVPRRTLERRVRHQMACTVNTLIERRRLELAETLLSDTGRTVADISEACGFATTRSLELLFRKYHQTTPAAYARMRRRGRTG